MGLFTERDEYDDFIVKPKPKDKLKTIGAWLLFLGGFLLVLYMITKLPPEHHNYEVRSVDGTIYHTTRIGRAHNNDRIWFRDEHGNSVELGGGYTIIEK